MKNIYTGIELGSNSIKIVVCEKSNDEWHVLASVASESSGIKNGQVVEMKRAIGCVREAFNKINAIAGAIAE